MIINMNGAKAPEPEQPDYQEKTTQATSFPVVVTPDVGYDALTKVTVTAPANLSAGNIIRVILLKGRWCSRFHHQDARVAIASE